MSLRLFTHSWGKVEFPTHVSELDTYVSDLQIRAKRKLAEKQHWGFYHLLFFVTNRLHFFISLVIHSHSHYYFLVLC